MIKITQYLSAACIILFASCNQHNTTKVETETEGFSKDSLVQHIKVLASDSFQGRKPFSAGETRAVDYITNTFKKYGLEPGNGNTYLQDVPLVEITPHADSIMKVRSSKGSITL